MSKRIAILLTTVGMLLAFVTGVALASVVTCTDTITNDSGDIDERCEDTTP
jgi:hypothetical protein